MKKFIYAIAFLLVASTAWAIPPMPGGSGDMTTADYVEDGVIKDSKLPTDLMKKAAGTLTTGQTTCTDAEGKLVSCGAPVTGFVDVADNSVLAKSGTTVVAVSTQNIKTTGTIQGATRAVLESTATTYNIDAADAYGVLFINTNAGTKTFVLPSAVAGMTVCVRNGQGVNQILRLDAAADDYIVMSTGTRTSAASEYYGATASPKNQVCVVAADATDWYVTGEVGTWTEE
jgi:hypothetical protein